MHGVAYPRQVILVSSRGHVKKPLSKDIGVKDNIFTLSWHMPVSFNPELYAIAVGKKRFSLGLLRESGVFVVNFMPYKLKEAVLFCGSHSGEFIDKFKDANLTKEEAESIDCCRIKEATGCLECEVVNEIDAGDHVIIVGKVLKVIVKKDEKRVFQKLGADSFTTTV